MNVATISLSQAGRSFIGDRISVDRLWMLLSPWHHPHYIAHHRASTIISRVRIFAWAFAVLNLAWIVVDFAALPLPVAGELALLRLVSTAVFAYLGWRTPDDISYMQALWRLAVLILNPLVFYLAAQAVFASAAAVGAGGVLPEIYGLLPLIVVAGLAVFPLTVSETAAFGLVSLITLFLRPIMLGGVTWQTYLPVAWILILLIGICVLAAGIQLNYMTSLLRQVSVDTLTGAFTRASGQDLIDLYFRIAQEQKARFAIAYVDLDYFKAINDEYGHEAGDAALRDAVAGLRKYLRASDTVVRWGGEEFLLVLPGVDEAGIRLVLDRMLRHWLGTRPDGSPLTASIGTAERIADGVTEWPELVELADGRMYRAKRGGRARAMLWGEKIVRPESVPTEP